MSMNEDRNLLFGVMALQAGLIDDTQFADVCSAWASRRNLSVADHLVERGWLTAEEKDLIKRLLEHTLRRHDGDTQSSLAATTTNRVQRAITQVSDPAIRQALTCSHSSNHAHRRAPVAEVAGTDRYTRQHLHATDQITQTWQALDEQIGRTVALKELLPTSTADVASWSELIDEALLATRLEHPAIAPVYEVSRGGDIQPPCYTQRWVGDRSLAQVIADSGSANVDGLSAWRNRMLWYLQICNAIAYAHGQGVYHGALDSCRVRVADFDAVTVVGWELRTAMKSADPPPGLPNGLDGQWKLTAAERDQYALGAILYEILTGHAIPAQLDAARPRREPIVPPRQRSPHVPAALEAICLKTLADKPGERYSSVEALGQDIRNWLVGELVRAERDTVARRVQRWAGTHRLLATGAAAACLAAMLVALATGWKVRHDHEVAERLALANSLKMATAAVNQTFDRLTDSLQRPDDTGQKLRNDLVLQYKQFYEHQAMYPILGDRAEQGRNYLRLAEAARAESGMSQEVLTSAAQAATIFEQLVQEVPDSAEYQQGQFNAWYLTGLCAAAINRPDMGQPALKKALPVAAKSAADHPDSAEDRLHQVAILNRLADIAVHHKSELRQAEDYVHQALPIAQSLVHDHPEGAEYAQELVHTWVTNAWLEEKRGDIAKAVNIQANAVPLLQRLVRLHPNNRHYQEALTDRLWTMVSQASQIGLPPSQCQVFCEQAFPVAEKLARDYPGSRDNQFRLAQFHLYHVIARIKQGAPQEAVAEFEQVRGRFAYPEVLYNGACICALASAAVRHDSKLASAAREEQAVQYENRAMKFLTQLSRTRYWSRSQNVDTLQRDPDLDPLRQRADFKQLLRQLTSE